MKKKNPKEEHYFNFLIFCRKKVNYSGEEQKEHKMQDII